MSEQTAVNRRIELTVPAGEAGDRLDLFLRAHLPAASRHRLRAALRDGSVRVNGAIVRTGVRLAAGDRVSVPSTFAEAEVGAAPELPLVVRYESGGCVVVDKPSPLPTAPLAAAERTTLANALVARYPELRGIGRRPLEPGILHRLDNETSGLVLAARTESAFRELRAQADAGEIVKSYRAAVRGVPPPCGTIDLPIAHHANDPIRMCAVMGPQNNSEHVALRGRLRAARSVFRVVSCGGGVSLLDVEIRRGARHQIRVHLASIGFPILGDMLYDPEAIAMPRPVSRHFLHASGLTFVDPSRGLSVAVASPLPDELLGWLDRLGLARPDR